MRMDLSREEEIKNLPSESLGLVSMNAFQKEFIERIGCRVHPIKLKGLNSNKSKTVKSIKKALMEFRFNKLEQFSPESKTNKKRISIDEYGSKNLSLEDRLIKFDEEVIRKECPNTPEGLRLMRPKMLEMLLERQPINIVEFGEKIPPYLRIPMQTLHPKNPDYQSKYIKDVVNIIGEFWKR